MKKRTTKAISVFLVLIMVFSSVPFSGAGLISFAEDEFNEVNNLLLEESETENPTTPDSKTNTDLDTEGNCYEITVGETITIEIVAEKITYIKFVPQASGTFIFTSHSEGDTYGYLCDENKEQLVYDDDNGEGSNFLISCELEADKTYYFGARYYSNDRSGSFAVSLEAINIESISFTPAEPIVLTEEIDGNWTYDWVWDEGGEYEHKVFWFRYNTPSIYRNGNIITVNYNDDRGSVEYYYSDEGAFVSKDGDYIASDYFNYSSNQSYDNQWTVGGENYLTVSYFGKSCQVPVEIKENPVESISFTPAEPIVLTEEIDGYLTSDWVWNEETEENTEVSWFCYNTPSIYKDGNILTVNYNDVRGSVDYYFDSDEWEFVSRDGDYIASDYFNYSSNQSYDNQWTVGGENYLTVSYLSKSCQVPVEIKENPVESISFTPAEPIVLTEEIDGYWTSDWIWNEETEEKIEVSWFCYNIPSIFKGGNVLTVNYNDERGSVDYYFDTLEWAFISADGDIIRTEKTNTFLDQSYENKLSLGENSFTLSYMGRECEVSFTIVKNPVDSISFTPAQPIVLTEEVEGSYQNHWVWDEEAEKEYVDDVWFRYYTPSIYENGNILTVNYNDERGSVDYCFNASESAFVSADGEKIGDNDINSALDQSYDNQLSIGENSFTLSYNGRECEVSFTIVKNPVDSISFTPAQPIVLTEEVEGSYQNHWVWDEEAEKEYVDDVWFRYYTPSIYENGNILTVNYNDERGSVEYCFNASESAFISADGDIIRTEKTNTFLDQSYENKLSLGENSFTLSYMGRECEVSFTIVKNPVDSISFTPAQPIVLTEEVEGSYQNHWVWDEEAEKEYVDDVWFCYYTPSIYKDGNVLTVNYNDGRGSVEYCFNASESAFISADGEKIGDNDINSALDQSYDNQLSIGDNSFTLSYMGRECEVSFTIVKNPVESISFIPAQPFIITEETNGFLEKHWAYDEETESEYVDGEWFRYYTPSIYEDGNVLTVNYNDERGSVDYCFNESEWAFISADGEKIGDNDINSALDQSYDNQLSIGENSFTLSYNGRECEVSFTIVKNPVDSISFTPAQPIVLTEGIDGNYQKHWVWDEETETEYVDEEWFCYYTPSIYEDGNVLTVNYNDGRGSVEYTYSRINDTDWIWEFVSKDGDTISQKYIECELIQSFENRLPIGENSFSLSYMGRKCEVSFTTVKNPVDSISFTPAMPITLIEGFDGFYQENWAYDEETGNEYVDGEWFRYYTPPIYREGNKLTVNYNDGRGSVDYVCVFNRSNYEYIYSNDEYGELSNDINTYLEQSYDNQLSLGENTLYLKYMNRVCEVPFTIIENPVESISFTPANPIIYNLNENGYYETHLAWDEEKEETYVDGEWFCYYTPSIYEEGNILTVNYNDSRGSVEYICQYDEDEDWYLYVNSEHGELKYYIDVYLEQSYENQLSVGENIFTISILNKECNVPFLIVDPDAVCKHENLYDAVVENRVDATCKEPGRYDEVIYCKDCEEEVSRVEKQLEKLPHTEKAIPAVEATCTTTGLTEGKKCSVCGEILVAQTVTDALGHSFTNYVSNNDATCTADGTKTAKCDRCNATDTITDVGSAKGHAEEIIPAVKATCIATGLTEGKKCSVCGDILVAQTVTNALGHSFKNYVSNNDATCTADGTKTAKCDRCNATDTITDVGSAKGHAEEIIPAVKATCTATGLTEGKKCSVCGDVLVAQTVTNALGHSFGEWATVTAPTCTSKGTEKRVCANDASHVETRDIDTIAHTEATREENRVEATCTADGSYDLVTYCSVCEAILNTDHKTTPATGIHNYETEVEGTRISATCVATGSVTMKCACGAIKEVTLEIDPANHANIVTDEAVSATCEEAGSTEGSHCSDCNTVLVEQTVVPAKGHSFGEWAAVTAATCTAKGTEKRVCANDASHVETRDIDTIAHTEATREENRVEATCTTDGSYDLVVYCPVCNNELSRETKTIDKLGHSFTNYVSNNDATCTADGTKTAKCERCEVTDTIADIGSAKSHTEKTVNATAASCTESGYTGDVVCSVCNEVISKGTVITKLAHKTVVDKAVAATCTKTGLTEGSHCSVCGTVIKKQTTVAKKAHSYKDVITKADAGKKKSGNIIPTCSVCGKKGKATAIAYPKTATLKFTSATYTGKAIKPSVTVKDSAGKVISSKYYTVSYKDNTNVGKATVTITFKGNYTGKITKTFTINPKGTSISKLTAKSKGFTATWKKQATQTTGYEIQYSTSSKFTSKTTKTIKVTSSKTVSKTVSKLKANSTYYVRVRTYKTVSKTNYYSAWSKVVSVKTKK